MTLKPGFINRQFFRIEEDYKTWPEWLKRGANMENTKNQKLKLYRVYDRYGDYNYNQSNEEFYMAFSKKEVIDDLRRRKKCPNDYDIWSIKFRTPNP
jgi:hypothetical protein